MASQTEEERFQVEAKVRLTHAVRDTGTERKDVKEEVNKELRCFVQY